ncbi:hypothetical protein LX36DRAFT_681000 [Colletotrichum falcatum]|nr:hypothetical protein LX36DRAFT_681000 [Colletotrichum falcatum]
MLRSKFPTAHHFTVSIFGAQYHADSPSEGKLVLINRFNGLVKGAAIHVEELEQNDLPSKVWMSYWASPQAFKTWWESPKTAAFWSALPDDAGFWRETVSIPATRGMYESNKPQPSGFGHCDEPIPLTAKTGYWGAYRSRMTPDSPEDNFESPLPAVPTPRPLSDKIRSGRVRVSKFPDNISFVVEGQDYSYMNDNERGHWNENFDSLTKQWVTNVMTAGREKGMVNARACHAFAGDKQTGATNDAVNGHATNGTSAVNCTNGVNGTNSHSNSIFPGLNFIRLAQILFWLDLSKMEYIGRYDKVHEGGDLLLWVDVAVLKSEEMDAEYVGCYDGTGFLAYDDHSSFASEVVEASQLTSFFDKPIPSQPIEW